jgi:hypothetical protein
LAGRSHPESRWLRASEIARRRTEEKGAEAFFLASDDDGGGFKARCASSPEYVKSLDVEIQ